MDGPSRASAAAGNSLGSLRRPGAGTSHQDAADIRGLERHGLGGDLRARRSGSSVPRQRAEPLRRAPGALSQ